MSKQTHLGFLLIKLQIRLSISNNAPPLATARTSFVLVSKSQHIVSALKRLNFS